MDTVRKDTTRKDTARKDAARKGMARNDATRKPGAPPQPGAIAEILAPLAPKDFAASHFGQRFVLLPGPAARAEPVMTWSRLTELLNLRSLWTPDRVVLYLDRQRVPAAQYCDVLDEGGKPVQRPTPGKIAAWVDRGASVIVNDIGSLLPGLRAWVASLAAATGGNVQVNLYASRAEHQAFGPHFDTHEVFALHCEGRKVWRVYDLRAEHPVNHPAFKKMQPPQDMAKFLEREFPMTPGDVVYIPRGTYHEALASSYGSLHVTFGVTRPLGLDLLSLLWGRLIGESRLRQPVPLSCGLAPDGDAALGGYLQDLVAALAKVAGDPQVQNQLREQLGTFAAQAPALDEGTFSGKR